MAKKKKEQKPLTQNDISRMMEFNNQVFSSQPTNNQSATAPTPLTDTQKQARQYIQSVYDSNLQSNNSVVPTSNSNQTIPTLDMTGYNNPNVPDAQTRQSARDYIQSVFDSNTQNSTPSATSKTTPYTPHSSSQSKKSTSEGVLSNKKVEEKAQTKEKTSALSTKPRERVLNAVEQNALYQATHNGSLGKKVETSKTTANQLTSNQKNKETELEAQTLKKDNVFPKEKGKKHKNDLPNIENSISLTAQDPTQIAQTEHRGNGASTYFGEDTPQSVYATYQKYNTPGYQRTNTADLDDAKKYANDFEDRYDLNFNPLTQSGIDEEKEKEQYLINSGVVTQEQLNALKGIGYIDSATENLTSFASNFGNSAMRKTRNLRDLTESVVEPTYIPNNSAIPNIPRLSNQQDKELTNLELAIQNVNNPIASGSGSLLGGFADPMNLALYGGANELLENVGKKTLLNNMVKGQLTDVALDTIPMMAENVKEGVYRNEDGSFDTLQFAKDLGTNQLENAFFNVVPELVLGNNVQKMDIETKTRETLERLKQERAVQNNADALKPLENNLVDNLTDSTENVLKNANNELDTVNPNSNVVRTEIEDIMARNEADIPKSTGTFKDTKVDGFNQLDANINSMQKMYGDAETEAQVVELKNLLNDYANTGNEQSLTQARQIANDLDTTMANRSYTTQKGKSIPYGTNDTFGFEVDNIADSLRNISSVRSKTMPGLDELNGKIDNLVANFGASEDMSRVANEYKQAITNLASNPTNENLSIAIQKSRDLYNTMQGAEKTTNTFKGTKQKFDYDTDFNDIVSGVEDIYRNPNKYNVPTQNMEQPKVNEPTMDKSDELLLNSGDTANSKVYTNTLDSKMRAVNMNNRKDQINARYEVHHKDDVVGVATNRVTDNFDGWDNYYRSEGGEIASDVDVHSVMQIINEKQDLINELKKNNGDMNEIARLTTEKDILARKLRKFGTERGQEIKAFDYWNGTSEGAIMNANRLLDKDGQKWANTHKKDAKAVKDAADKLTTNKKLQNALNDLVKEDVAPVEKPIPTHNEILSEVKNTLDNEYASLSKSFTDNDYEYITNMLENNVSKTDLADMMNTRLATGTWGISQEAIDNVNLLFDEARKYGVNSKERVELETQAFWVLANDGNPNTSIADKLDSWRYLAMLGNPKTHVRNIVGNAMFQEVTNISDDMAAGLEAIVDKASKKFGGNGIDRTKSILTKADDGLRKATLQDANDNAYRQLKDSHYNDVKREIRNQREAFSNNNKLGKTINKLNNLNSDFLDNEDFMFSRKKYSRSLAGYLKANGLDESVFAKETRYNELKNSLDKLDAKASIELLSASENEQVRALRKEMNSLKADVDKLTKGREYAVEQAKYSTFHEDNVFADWLTDTGRKLNTSDNKAMRLGGKLYEGILPFKKTPANILKSGIEYSPAGLIKNITYDLGQLAKGNIDTSKFLENISKGATGTIMTAIGSWLYGKGILTSSNELEQYQDQLEGKQNYALNIGGKTFTIDFAAPSCMPLLLGAEFRKLWDDSAETKMDEEGNEIPKTFWENFGEIMSSASRLTAPVMETSMLSGLNDTLDTLADNGGTSALGSLAVSMGTGYLTQMVPTALGQIARAIDPTRRSTYVDIDKQDKKNQFGYGVEKQLQKIENKIPFVSMFNEPYVDSRGNQQSNSPVDTGFAPIDFLGNLAYQSLSPSYIADVDVRPQDEMAREVFNNMSEPNSKVFADYKTTKKINGVPISPEMYTTYSTEKGKSNDAMRELLATDERYRRIFDNLPQDMKESILTKINTLSDKVGEAAINPNFESSSDDFAAYTEGQERGAIDYYFEEAKKTLVKNTLKEYGIPDNDITKSMVDSNDIDGLKVFKDFADKGIKLSKKDYEALQEIPENEKEQFTEYLKERKTTDESYTKESWESFKGGEYDDFVDYKNKIKELGISDNKQFKEAYEQGNLEQIAEEIPKLEDYGLDKKSTVFVYENATSVIPNLDMDEFANTFKRIDSNGNQGITQDEVIAYLNRGNYSQSEGTKIWNAYYGTSKGKSIPKLVDGKWKKVKK